MRKLAAFLVLAVCLWSAASALAHRHPHHRSGRVLGCPAHQAAHSRHGCRIIHRHHRLSHTRRRGQRLAVTGGGGTPVVRCDLFASPGGSDSSGNGSISTPFQTLAQLDRSLHPGQTGCMRAGSYGSTHTWHKVYANGAPSARITITSYPGEIATIVGYVDIEASYTTLTHLRIDGSNTLYQIRRPGTNCAANISQSLVIGGHDDILDHVDYFQSIPQLRGNGIGIGYWGNADNTIIRYSMIHDVGQCMAYDHLIYLASGNNVQIYGNWLWNDPHGRGVQLYPAPTNAKVFGNVIDHAGEAFVIGNKAGSIVSGNQIFHNVVSNCVGLPWQGIPGQAIHDLYGGVPGTGNGFYANLVYNNPGGVGRLSAAVQAHDNIIADPQYLNPAAHDYRVLHSSPAAGWGLWSGQ